MASEVSAESLEMGPVYAIWLRQYGPQISFSDFLQRLMNKKNMLQDDGVPVLPDDTFQSLRAIKDEMYNVRTHPLMLSRASLREFDALMAGISIEQQADILDDIARWLRQQLHVRSCSISIDFSEVFMVG